MPTSDAAAFIRARLSALDPRVSQDEMQTLMHDLNEAMGRPLTPGEAAEVVDTFADMAERSGEEPAGSQHAPLQMQLSVSSR